jgi:Ca2+-binding RTX toxin-like protein
VRVIAYGQDGNDNISASAIGTMPVELHGDAGSDTLTGGGGASLLLGGTGGDMLIGGVGRAIMIGGTGADSLSGAGAEDLLIGGTTVYDDDDAALREIVREWSDPARTYTDRVGRIKAAAFASRLGTGTVINDGASDTYTGGKGNDWFISSTGDVLKDKAAGEVGDLV